MRFNDVRDDDDDKTWRGDEAWRKNVGKFKTAREFLLHFSVPLKSGLYSSNTLNTKVYI